MDTLELALIIGSNRDGRFGIVVADWLVAVIDERDDFHLDVIDLDAVDLPVRWTRDPLPHLEEYRARLERADAFVVVTPEYNHSFPAGLKQAIDLSQGQFARKPVAFVSYGGFSGGIRSVEHLRPVFAELHAATIRESVSFHQAWERFDADGWPHDASVIDAAGVMLDDLAWWGTALRAGRHAHSEVTSA